MQQQRPVWITSDRPHDDKIIKKAIAFLTFAQVRDSPRHSIRDHTPIMAGEAHIKGHLCPILEFYSVLHDHAWMHAHALQTTLSHTCTRSVATPQSHAR